MELNQLLNHDITCSCGRTHRCDIDLVDIGRGAIERLPESARNFENILLVADSNTYAVCGERVCNLLGEKIKDTCLFVTDDLLVPDEAAVGAVREKMTPATDLILGMARELSTISANTFPFSPASSAESLPPPPRWTALPRRARQ